MQSTASNLEFKLNVNLRLVKSDFMQSTAVNLEFKLKVIFKLLSCNRPIMYTANITLSLLKHCKPWSDFSVWNSLIWVYNVCPYTYFYLSKADIVHRGTYIEQSDQCPHWLPPYLWCHCTFISQNEYRQLIRVYFSADAARAIFQINIQVNLRFKQTLWTLIRLLLWRCLFWVHTVCLYTCTNPKSATIRNRRIKQVTFSNVSFKG